ncbi:MAG: 4-demethylwyosine synthase TYW1 [Nanoarchaeota archaeon]
MLDDSLLKKLLQKQHYGLIGRNSAVKICEWTKKSLRDEGFCYKQQFYGIRSHLCCQMTPATNFCSHSCIFCWRPLEPNLGVKMSKVDDPSGLIDACIEAQRKKLSGFGGNKKVNISKLKEAQNPKHFAISLSGEPTLFPKLPTLISELKKRKLSSFLVTNGTNPSMLRKLVKNQPTQLYITLPAPDEETYNRVCQPTIKNGWKKIRESLLLIKKFKRSAVRLTLVKDLNMIKPDKYAQMIMKANPVFVECKAYMFVGSSRLRLSIDHMPYHSDIKKFAGKIAECSDYKIIDEKKESRVVLLMKKDKKSRIMKF